MSAPTTTTAGDVLANRTTLRLCTAGSVDDGKSTFVGRLLHDTRSVLSDQLESVAQTSRSRGFDGLDLSLLVDGLRAEREQGITIDVAYRYFATDKRTFILADTPGHVQYTRNTVTGMSTSQLVVLLIDARHGVVEQTRRHLTVAALLGIEHVVLAVNKIDAVDYSESVFNDIVADLNAWLKHLGENAPSHVSVVPISALRGDNVVERSEKTPWYDGPSVLEILENTVIDSDTAATTALRFPVQYVIREHATDYRGYAGRIKLGTATVGDAVSTPGGRETTIVGIDSSDGPVDNAVTGDSVVLRLADDIDLARGDLITAASSRPMDVRCFPATIVGLTEKALTPGQMLALRYGPAEQKARITSIERIISLDDEEHDDADQPTSVELNAIAHVTVETARELPVEDYSHRGATGAFLLTDPGDGQTLAAGLVGHVLS